MNKLRLATALIGLTLALAACSDSDKGHYSDLGGDNGGNLPSDQLNTSGDNTGLQENARPPGNFNPDTDVDYSTLNAETIYFAFDSSNIAGQERGKLQQVADWMKANPGRSLFLAGHADKRGTPEYNRALGERRALSVREYLVGLGLPATSLYTNSYGSDRPAVDGDTEEAYAKNRRVQVGIIQTSAAVQQQ
jgi:outer membrane protein OmpA-like peptidoglycan-associated protein